METLEQIALRCWYADNELMPSEGMLKLQQFSRRLLEEIGKQQEPVGYFYKDHTGSWRQAWDDQFFAAHTPLYTTPQPTPEEVKDADRYRWLRKEHERFDPMATVVWKKNCDRNSSEWVNTAILDDSVDAAMAAELGTHGDEK